MSPFVHCPLQGYIPYLLPLNSQTAQEGRQSRRSERKAPPADAPRALCAAPQRAVCVAARRGSNAVSRAFWDYIFGSGCVAKWICAVVWLGRGRPRARGIPVPAARCVGPQRPRASQQAQVDVSGTGWHGSGDSWENGCSSRQVPLAVYTSWRTRRRWPTAAWRR